MGPGFYTKDEFFAKLSDIFRQDFPIHQYHVEEGKLVSLFLDARYIKISSLPPELYKFGDLKTLVIQGQRGLDIASFEFNRFDNLEVLSIADNGCKRIPDSVAAMKSLKALYIGENSYEYIPSEFLAARGNKLVQYEEMDEPEESAEIWEDQFNDDYYTIEEIENLTEIYEYYREKFPFRHRGYSIVWLIPIIFIMVYAITTLIVLFVHKDPVELFAKPLILASILIALIIVLIVSSLMYTQNKRAQQNDIYPYPKRSKDSRLTIEHIPDLIEWLYSEDTIKELLALKMVRFLVTRTKELEEAINYLTRRGSFSEVRECAEETQEILLDLPRFESHSQKSPTKPVKIFQEGISADKYEQSSDTKGIWHILSERMRHILGRITRNYRTSSETDEITKIISARRCCKLYGRLGDKYCDVCGRLIPRDWIYEITV